MAHTFRNKSQANAQSNNPTVHSHTPGAAATVCVLSIVYPGIVARQGGAPTIDGTTATQIGTNQVAAENTQEMWYVCKAFSGSAFNVSIPTDVTIHVEVVTADAGSGYTSAYNHHYANASASNVNGFTATINTDAIGDFLYARVGCGENDPASISETSGSPTKTLTYSNDHGVQSSMGHYAIADTAGTEQFVYAWSSDDGNIIAVSFKSVGGSTTYTKTPSLDGFLQKTFTKTPSLDGNLNKVGMTKTPSLDAFKQKTMKITIGTPYE